MSKRRSIWVVLVERLLVIAIVLLLSWGFGQLLAHVGPVRLYDAIARVWLGWSIVVVVFFLLPFIFSGGE